MLLFGKMVANIKMSQPQAFIEHIISIKLSILIPVRAKLLKTFVTLLTVTGTYLSPSGDQSKKNLTRNSVCLRWKPYKTEFLHGRAGPLTPHS